MQEFTTGPTTTEDIPPGPDSKWQDMTAAPEENPAKRRRGRPPKDPNAPKRTYTRRTASRTSRSLLDQIGGTLTMLNLAFAFMPEPWRGDMLDPSEITALAQALDNAAKANPTMHKYMSAVLVEGGSMADLVLVAGLIAGRRLARHGIIDGEFDARLGTFLEMRTGIPSEPVPLSVVDASP